MAATIRQNESAPASYPDAPASLTTAAAALDAEFVWQRIEAHTAYRWSARAVEWIVDGCGEWVPPLSPVTISTVEIWQSEAWETVTLLPSPLGGYCLPGGTYRFTGTAGEDGATVPAAVVEAFRRLAEYMVGKAGKPGASSESLTAGSISLSHRRSPAWMAQAIQNSGAGDLLRSYRRAA
ncbi:hypothetical protein [Breoghania sp.]|uniref:hypothetical protein n=1 Tax=Breoghania sp. TaxID=2065378 RepID=UPI002AA77CD1|nr:hypothetical protein [Breoghania sp.]